MDLFIYQFEPVVQKGHESLVHHILLFKCPAVDPKFVGMQYVCDDAGIAGFDGTGKPGLPPPTCYKVELAWATGGEVRPYILMIIERTLTPPDTWSCPIWDLHLF